MFLIALTRQPLQKTFPDGTAGHFMLGPFSGICIATGVGCRAEISETGGSVHEHLPGCDFESCVFTRITWKTSEGVVRVNRGNLLTRSLYFHRNRDGEVFVASHIRLLKMAGIQIEENARSLPEFFLYRMVAAPQTMYKDIFQVPPGGTLSIVIAPEGCDARIEGGLKPPEPDIGRGRSEQWYGGQVIHLLEKNLRVVGENGATGLLFSGGLDSSILYQVNRRLGLGKDTYSTVYPFENSGIDCEREYALSASALLHSNHSLYELTSEEYYHGIIDAISGAEEPLIHLQSTPIYLLIRHGIPESRNTIISGGGEGIFSYNEYHRIRSADGALFTLLSYRPCISLIRSLSRLTGRGGKVVRRASMVEACRDHSSPEDLENPIWSIDRYGDTRWIMQYFGVSERDILQSRMEYFRPYAGRDLLELMQIHTYVTDVFLTQLVWSKLAEAAHRMFYFPFGTQEMVSLAFSIPAGFRNARPKHMAEVISRMLEIPEPIIGRPKSGFGLKWPDWSRPGGIFEPLVPSAAKVFDLSEIRHVQAGGRAQAMTFWNILNYSLWNRIWIKGEDADAIHGEITESLQSQQHTPSP